MAELKLITMRLDALIPYDKNPRKNDKAVPKMVRAFSEFGFRVPILARSSGEIIDGHLRYKAAKQMGLEEVPVILADDMSEAQIKAFRIAINKSAEWADWDMDLLLDELRELRAEDFDLALTGFDASELERMLQDMGDGNDPDAMPAEVEVVISQPGDIWLLGEHRLMCGDACDKDTANRLMNGSLLDMVWTDPPYGVNYVEIKDKALRTLHDGLSNKRHVKSDNFTPDQLQSFLEKSFANYITLMQAGASIYVTYAGQYGAPYYDAFINAGFKLQMLLVWIKNNIVISRQDYQPQHEPILYGWKPGAHKWYGGRKEITVRNPETLAQTRQDDGSIQLAVNGQIFILRGENISVEMPETDILHFNKPQKSKLHPTMKPVALIERMVMNSSQKGDLVGDFFGGSGSTLIACEKSGRKARVMELDPYYVDTIIRRWQDYSGGVAVRESDGKTYNELAEAANGK